MNRNWNPQVYDEALAKVQAICPGARPRGMRNQSTQLVEIVNADDDAFFRDEDESEIFEERQLIDADKLGIIVGQMDSYVNYVLSDLEDCVRETVRLRTGYYGRSYSYDQIAAIYKVSAQSIRNYEHKAIAKLRNLKDYEAMLKIISGWSEDVTMEAELAKEKIQETS